MALPREESSKTAVDMLSTIYRNTEWSTQREPTTRETRLGFRCRASGSVLIDDIALVDAKDPSQLVFQVADRLFGGMHEPLKVGEHEPFVACPNCRLVVPVPNQNRMDPFDSYEYAERMATRWMERAAELQKAMHR